MRKGKLARTIVFLCLVAVLTLGAASVAFAAYSSDPVADESISVGDSVSINPVAHKDAGDPGDADTYYYRIHVTGPGAESGSVVTVSGWDLAHRVYVPGMDVPFEEFLTWVGNTGQITGPAAVLQFDQAGTYQIDLTLRRDDGLWPNNPTQASDSFTVNVAATPPPPVATPASSSWSIALLALAGLGAAGTITYRRRRSA